MLLFTGQRIYVPLPPKMSEMRDHTMKKLLLSAIFILIVLCMAPALRAQQAIGDTPRPAALAAQETPAHTEPGAVEEKSTTDEPDNTDPAEALKEIRENLRLLRGRQADMGADMTNLADQVRKLRGELEEMRNPEQIKSDRKDSQARLEDPATRMKKVENLTGNGKSPAKEGKRDATQTTPPPAAQEGKSDLKELYLAAFNDYKSRKYDGARRKFQAFLKQFPQASLASGAQFWIGECYYMEGNFEKAILEYDKVLLNYPKGEMVPHALLKQGLSFLKIGDKTGAKILLEKLSSDYPNTDQANIAKSTLATLK
jgi:tol-pal system protein YbgF